MESLIQQAFQKTFGKENDWKVETSDVVQKANEAFGLDYKQAKIAVVGAGGGGNNTITTLFEMGIGGADTFAFNTDAKHLYISKAGKKVLIGKELTRGLGAGGYPEVGKKAAEESAREIKESLNGVDMIFLTCGLGGGTGTGSAPVIAGIAKTLNPTPIVIATVTMPFKMEGTRTDKAEDGLKELRKVCDTVIVIENQKLLKLAGNLPLRQAFAVADQLIATMIKGITETITLPSLVNLDYADVKAIMNSGGVAAIGIGEGSSSERAKEAISKALKHPLLEVDYNGAKGALIQIIGGEDLKLEEVNQIGEEVAKQLDPDAQVIWGARISPNLGGKIQVITIVTGIKSPYILGKTQERDAKFQLEDDLGIPIIR